MSRNLRVFCLPGCLLAVLLLTGCGRQRHPDVGESAAGSVLKLASTTSTRDSGLYDVLLPEFEQAHNCRVDLIAVGTGAALKLGETGDVDAVLCHAREAEDAFMAAAHGVRHEPVMHNYFVIAGPPNDPAGIKGTDPLTSMNRIAAAGHRFVSRGDSSGTHQREELLWKKAGGRPDWDEYIEAGQGMGPTLVMADELSAYVLCDEATWLKQSASLQLVPLVTHAKELLNPYAVMVVNPRKHPAVNPKLANEFADFLISAQAQRLIAEYKLNGHALFVADRLTGASEE